MAYNFKKMSDVNVLEEMNDTIQVLVEDGGKIAKISSDKMVGAYSEEIVNASVEQAVDKTIEEVLNVETLEEVNEDIKVLIEENGSLKKVPASAMSGGNGNFLVIRYKSEVISPESLESDPTDTFLANMTFAEFDEIVKAGELAGMYLNYFNQNNGTFYLYQGTVINVENYPDYYYLEFYHNQQNTIYMDFHSNNVLTRVYPPS